MSRHLTTFFPHSINRMHPFFPTGKREMWRIKGCREREREERLLTGLGGPCQTAVSGPAAHPRILLRRGLLCGSAPAVLFKRLTDTRTGGGKGAGEWRRCPGNIRLHQIIYFISVGAFVPTESRVLMM